MSKEYAGDVSPQECLEDLTRDETARLIDVRTRSEWAFVGIVVPPSDQQMVLAEWQSFPEMAIDPDFVQRLTGLLDDQKVEKDAHLYFLCRSGARSRSAAMAMSAAGYRSCFNISDGFEGGLDRQGHRGRENGWKAAGLPWSQK